jgi:hypothetical protein
VYPRATLRRVVGTPDPERARALEALQGHAPVPVDARFGPEPGGDHVTHETLPALFHVARTTTSPEIRRLALATLHAALQFEPQLQRTVIAHHDAMRGVLGDIDDTVSRSLLVDVEALAAHGSATLVDPNR